MRKSSNESLFKTIKCPAKNENKSCKSSLHNYYPVIFACHLFSDQICNIWKPDSAVQHSFDVHFNEYQYVAHVIFDLYGLSQCCKADI